MNDDRKQLEKCRAVLRATLDRLDSYLDVKPKRGLASMRGLREAKGWTQQQVADALRVQQTQYCRWEQGANVPHPVRLAQIARHFGVEEDALY